MFGGFVSLYCLTLHSIVSLFRSIVTSIYLNTIQKSYKTVICLTKYVNCVSGAVQCRQSSFITPNMVTIIGLTTFKSFPVTCAFLRIVSLMILLQRTLLHYSLYLSFKYLQITWIFVKYISSDNHED